MKTLSIATSCYNEVGNIREFYNRCRAAVAKCHDLDYEFVVADNCSTDGTRDALRAIAAEDPKFKVILNSANFGHIRSPYNALLNTTGDATVWICSDLQEPPEKIPLFVKKWREGAKVVAASRVGTRASLLMEFFRSVYYWLLKKSSHNVDVIPRFTGFGLYDRKVVDALRKFNDPYPYVRGLVSEIGFERVIVKFVQDKRKSGKSHNNFFTLYDMAMTGFINQTKFPLRMAMFLGFLVGVLSLIAAVVVLVLKCIYWEAFQVGMATLLIAQFFLIALLLVVLGIIGEYIGAIWTQVKNKPLAVEEERLNFT
jgi:glycosyltransferase involved in cell wall biosynthesis